MPLDVGERHKFAETPSQYHRDREQPVPQADHGVPDLFSPESLQTELLFFAEIVVTAFAGFTDVADFGSQLIDAITSDRG